MSLKTPSVKVCDLDLHFGDIKVLQKLNLEINQGQLINLELLNYVLLLVSLIN